jgi:site-specific DNA recombinase
VIEYLSDEDAFAELLARKTDKELLREQKRCEEELQKAMTRNDTVSRLYEKLYEDNATGKVSDEWFMQVDYLTAPLLRELIDHIDVFETEGIGKNRTQRIVIYYRFVGYVEIPTAPRHPHYKADTRQGVAAEYLTEPKTA